MTTADPRVTEAVRGGGVIDLDDRGLMPLAEARAVVRAVTAFVKGEGAIVGGRHVLASDQIWAALLSLADGAELVAAATRLDWQFHPRGFDNVDLHRRYGDAIVPWLATRVDADGVLHDQPWCVVPCLLACDGDAAFELVWRVRGEVRGRPLAPAWLARHPDTAARLLGARAAAGDARAAAHLAAIRARAGQPPTVDQILGLLDACADRLDGGAAALWPSLDGDGPRRCHGLRAIAARAGDDWELAIERLEGDRAGGVYPARIAVFAYGSRARGHLTGAAVRSRTLELAGAPPGPARFVAWLQRRLADDADAVWGPATAALPALGLPADAMIVAVVPHLAHVAATPSGSPVYRALAAALGGS